MLKAVPGEAKAAELGTWPSLPFSRTAVGEPGFPWRQRFHQGKQYVKFFARKFLCEIVSPAREVEWFC